MSNTIATRLQRAATSFIALNVKFHFLTYIKKN